MGPEGSETPSMQTAMHKINKIQRRTQPILCNKFKWIISYRILNHHVVHLKGISYYESTTTFKKSITSKPKTLLDIHMKQGDA